jgi:mono/diheme cytochrome c family protein
MRFGAFVLIIAFASVVSSAADSASIARGKYIVDEVAKCTQCHTPLGPDGKPDVSKYLKGGPIYFQPIEAGKIGKWHTSAPDITSTSSLWSRWGENAVKFFETGLNPRGNPADAPMPQYKMTHEDALAVVDYLKSVK